MSRPCPSCSRWFKSKQAIRAHLQFCESYLERKAAGLTVPEPARDHYECSGCGYNTTKDFSVCPGCGVRVE